MSESRRKIWKLYELLSEKELPICEAWITASVGGPTAKLAKLLKAMRKGGSDEVVWKRVYANEPLNDNRLRQLFFDLSRYLEDFIAFQQFRKAPFQRDLYLIKGLNRRGLAETFRYFYRKVKQRWERQPIRNSRYYWALYELEGESLHHANKFPKGAKTDYHKDIEKNLGQALALEIMKGALYSLSSNNNENPNDISEYINNLTSVRPDFNMGENGNLVFIYEGLLKLIKNLHEAPDFIINQVQSIWQDRSSRELELNLAGDKSHYMNLAYMVLKKLKLNTKEFPNLNNFSKLFEYYVWMIENELFQIDGLLPSVQYRSVIYQGLELQRWSEVEDMIDKFGQFLPAGSREKNQKFAKGRFYFHRKEFNKALPLLSIKFDHFVEDLLARFYVLKTQYELKGFDNLPYLIDLFKGFISRNKNIGDHDKVRYISASDFFKDLCKSRSYEDYFELKSLIIESKNIVSQKWLLEKCDEGMELMRIEL